MNKEYVFLNMESIGMDANGNSRVVTPMVNLLSEKEINEKLSGGDKLSDLYPLAVKRANEIGGKKYNTKNHPCHVVFQSTSEGRDIEKLINERMESWTRPIIKYGSIHDGSKVKFTRDYSDNSGEVFTVSQWDGNRGWAGDSDGRGWYFYAGQVLVKSGQNWLPVKSENDEE